MAGLSLGVGLSPRVGLSEGVGLGSGQLDGVSEAANFSNEFTSALPADWTFTRTGDQSFNDHEPLVKTETEDNQPAFVGARRVENLEDNPLDMTAGVWLGVDATVTSPTTATFDTANGYVRTQNYASTIAAGETVVWTVELSGSGTFKLEFDLSTGDQKTGELTLTSTPTRYSFSYTLPSTPSWFYPRIIRNGGTATGFTFGGSMVEIVTGQANQNPSEFVDGVAYYSTENGNTVTSNVVTEATGSALTGLEGVLLEDARTNLLTHSEQFDNAAWIKTNATITADDTAGPDGATTADKLNDDNSTGSGIVRVQQNASIASATDYTYSVYAKADQLDWVRLETANFDATGNGASYFDLTGGVTGTVDSDHSAGIEAAGNGWYRCWITFQSTTDLDGAARTVLSDGDGDATVDFDGTSSIYIWGAQLEQASFPSSYIATTTTALTRNATSLSRSWAFPANGFSFQVKVRPQFDYTESPAHKVFACAVAAGGSTDYLEIRYLAASDRFNLYKRVGGVAAQLISPAGLSYAAGDEINFRGRCDTDGIHLWVNGQAKISLTTGAAPTDWTTLLDTIYMNGNYNNTEQNYQSTDTLKIWNEAKSDAFLSALT